MEQKEELHPVGDTKNTIMFYRRVTAFMARDIPETTFGIIDDGGVRESFIDLNAQLNLWDENHQIQFDKDKEAARQYFLQHVNPNTVYFTDLEEKVQYLIDHNYYDPNVLGNYDFDFIISLLKKTYKRKYRFPTLISALKFYNQYALKTKDGKRYLERYEDRVVMNGLYLGRGDTELAEKIVDEIITNRFQPATPTFLNAGIKNRGMHISCFLLNVSDDLESISRTVTNSLQLSKNGGGVGICLTNIREQGAPIKGIKGASSGVVPIMKILEDSFSYANQLGARQGAGAVYLSCHHPDIMRALDTKRENADEKIRIKTLSIGVVISDKAFELARNNEDMYLFSPYDVEREYGVPMTEISVTEKYDEMVDNPRIEKSKINARKFFQTVAELQFESGYPYLLFEDTANRFHYIDGNRIAYSNLCSEILQTSELSTFNAASEYDHVGRDISCNLASVNIAKAMGSDNLGDTISTSIRALTSVTDLSDVSIVPPVKRGNELSHSVGLGAMNLHGFLGENKIHYGSKEALDFVNVFFATMRYHALNTSADIAKETGEKFHDFDKSGYAIQPGDERSEALKYYTTGVWETFPHTEKVSRIFEDNGQWFPRQDDWVRLEEKIQQHGLYHAYLLAVAPTGSISYVNFSTSSLHPVVSAVEVRKESKLGRIYSPAYGLTNDNLGYYKDAYSIGYQKVIDTYAVAQKHVDQGISSTLFFNNTNESKATTREVNRAYVYAFGRDKVKNEYGEVALYDPRTSWYSGIQKTLYYVRTKTQAIEGTEVECVSCMI